MAGFQPDAFQEDAFATAQPAFQPGAFQASAFQTVAVPLPPVEDEEPQQRAPQRSRARRAPLYVVPPARPTPTPARISGKAVGAASTVATLHAVARVQGAAVASALTSAHLVRRMDWLRLARIEDDELLLVL